MAERIFEMARDWIRKALADGTLDVIYSFPGGGAVTIGNADSHDDLMAKMRGFPARPQEEPAAARGGWPFTATGVSLTPSG